MDEKQKSCLGKLNIPDIVDDSPIAPVRTSYDIWREKKTRVSSLPQTTAASALATKGGDCEESAGNQSVIKTSNMTQGDAATYVAHKSTPVQRVPTYPLPLISSRVSVSEPLKSIAPSTSTSVGSSHPITSSPPKRLKTNSILVNRRQEGNPLLACIRNVPWEFSVITPDYELGQTTCCLFLSLRYHHLNPDYIYQRFKELAHNYTLRILLVLNDVKNPERSLSELAKTCILADCTLLVAFSTEEAALYLESLKTYEQKPPDVIMERSEDSSLETRMSDVLCTVRSVNRSDSQTLLHAFGSFEGILSASKEDLTLCPGLGPAKVCLVICKP